MRGLWHVTRTAKQPEYDESDHYRMIEALEIQAAKNASHVFTITDSVKNVLLKNGIEEEKITLLPNAVDIDKFTPRERNERIEQKFGSYGIDIVQSDHQSRVSFLYSLDPNNKNKKNYHTLAIVKFRETRKVSIIHERILNL